MNTNNPKFVRRDEDELPCMVTIDSDDEHYHLILREDDHFILKDRIKELELLNDERKEYKDACKSLGEEVARLRAGGLYDSDLQRECNRLRFELKLHKDALVEDRAYKAKQKEDFIYRSSVVRNMVAAYALENTGGTLKVLKDLARDIDAFDRDKKDD